MPQKLDELDMLLGLTSLALVFFIGYSFGKGKRRHAWLAAAALLVLIIWATKHAGCPDCRSSFTTWKRNLGLKFIE